MSNYIFDNQMNFIGDFEGLYKSDNNPWGQDGSDLNKYAEYYKLTRMQLDEVIHNYEGDVTEIGCGCGWALNWISQASDKKFTGVDISYSAIERAKELFPHLKFLQIDATKAPVIDDIVIINECLWYLIHRIDDVLENIKCKYLIINNGFIKEQKYATEIMNGWNGMVEFFVKRKYEILEARYDHLWEPLKNGLLVLRKSDD